MGVGEGVGMYEFLDVCMGVFEYARVCVCVCDCMDVCMGVFECARFCKSVRVCVYGFASVV